MKTRLLFLFILMNYSNLWAQDVTFVTIKAGSSIKDVLSTPDILVYPQFTAGNVFFRNGTRSPAMLNYNSLTDQVLFIDPKGDTLALMDEKDIKFITVDKDTFYYDDGYVRLVAGNSIVRLVEKKVWELADIRKMGTHNRSTTTFAVTSLSSVTDRLGRTYDLLLNEDLVLRKKATYYFGDPYYHFTPAAKKNLLMLFPKKQDSLANYLKENNTRFDKKDDLEKLTQFLANNN